MVTETPRLVAHMCCLFLPPCRVSTAPNGGETLTNSLTFLLLQQDEEPGELLEFQILLVWIMKMLHHDKKVVGNVHH